MTTILETFANTDALRCSAEYAGECTGISVMFGDSEEAAARAKIAAHYGALVLLRRAALKPTEEDKSK